MLLKRRRFSHQVSADGQAGFGDRREDRATVGAAGGGAATVAAVGETGAVADRGAKPVAGSGPGRRRLSKKETLEQGGPERTASSGAGSLDEPPPGGLAKWFGS